MFAITNWKTTLSGLVAAGAQGVAAAYPQYAILAHIVTGIALAALGVSAKDKDVTGGTVSAITGVAGKPVSLIDRQ